MYSIPHVALRSCLGVFLSYVPIKLGPVSDSSNPLFFFLFFRFFLYIFLLVIPTKPRGSDPTGWYRHCSSVCTHHPRSRLSRDSPFQRLPIDMQACRSLAHITSVRWTMCGPVWTAQSRHRTTEMYDLVALRTPTFNNCVFLFCCCCASFLVFYWLVLTIKCISSCSDLEHTIPSIMLISFCMFCMAYISGYWKCFSWKFNSPEATAIKQKMQQKFHTSLVSCHFLMVNHRFDLSRRTSSNQNDFDLPKLVWLGFMWK